MDFPAINNIKNISKTELREQLKGKILTKKEIDYVLSIFNNIEERGEISIDETFNSIIKTKSGARKRLNNLCEINILNKTYRRIKESHRPVTIYSFNKNELLINKDHRPIEDGDFFKGNKKEDNNKIYLDLVTGVLFSAMSLNRKSSESVLKSRVSWNGLNIEIESRAISSTKSEISSGKTKTIAKIHDLKFYISALYCAEKICIDREINNESQKNNFAISIYNINEMLGRNNTGGNISSAISSLERLSQTQFKIMKMPTMFLNRFNFKEGEQTLTPINNLGIYNSNEHSKQSSKIAIFSFPDFIYSSLSRGFLNTSNYNPNFLKEKNDVIFSLHLFCKRIIKSNPSEIYSKKISEFKNDCLPSLDIKTFKDKLFMGLERIYNNSLSQGIKPNKNNKNKILNIIYNSESLEKEIIQYHCDIYGYFITIHGQQIIIRVNNSDQYVGLPSAHKPKNSKDKLEAELERQLKLI